MSRILTDLHTDVLVSCCKFSHTVLTQSVVEIKEANSRHLQRNLLPRSGSTDTKPEWPLRAAERFFVGEF